MEQALLDRIPLPDHGPWLDVDLGALVRNARDYARRVGVPLIPMVKANGYGLGAVPVARSLEPLSPWGYGVATLVEARELRVGAIERPIVVFSPFVAAALEGYLALDARPSLGGLAELEQWLARSERPFHVAIDTGMGRGGVSWRDSEQVAAMAERLGGVGVGVGVGVGFEGVFTHFHSADSDPDATETQWRRFEDAIAAFRVRPPVIHAANSAAAQWGGRYAGTAARPGIFLYGGKAGPLEPEPVAGFEAMVLAARAVRAGDTVSYGATYQVTEAADVVTLGAGYADGVFRSLGNRGLVAFGDRLYPIAGRVTMDMTMVVVPSGTVRVGDTGTFFGGPNPLDAQAERAGTISYELLTAVGRRVARRYHGGPR